MMNRHLTITQLILSIQPPDLSGFHLVQKRWISLPTGNTPQEHTMLVDDPECGARRRMQTSTYYDMVDVSQNTRTLVQTLTQ